MRRFMIIVGLAALAATGLPVRAGANAAGPSCPLIRVPTAGTPVGTGGCPGVRPGSRLLNNFSGLCTAGFLFRAPDGTRYISTAAHCIGEAEGGGDDPHEQIWPPGRGPRALDASGRVIGRFAYGALSSHATGVGVTYDRNFALIRLDPRIEASPEMCFFGGPSGVYTANTDETLVLHYYGGGDTLGDVLPARSGVARGTPEPNYVYATGLAAAGDGGSPVVTADGLAVGMLVTFSAHGVGFSTSPGGPPPAYVESQQGTIGITRLAPQLARASEAMGIPLELVTAASK
jgi:hypothetical protein